jgi:chromosome segregation ATPase
VKKLDTPLAIAAQQFEEELARYAQLGDAFVKTPMSSTKQLERANELITEIAAQEERLSAAGQKLVMAVTAARGKQEELAALVVGKLPELKARNEVLRSLLAELAQIGADTGGLNDRAAGMSADAARTDPTARELVNGMQSLHERAAALAAKARDAQLDELATQAHALHQKLFAAWKKLDKAVPQAPS